MAFGGEPDDEILSVQSEFDDKGNLVSESRIDESDLEEKHIYSYNDAGKQVRHELVIESDGISESYVFERDDKHRIISETKFYGDDPGECVKYEYVAHDQPVRIERFDSDGEKESVDEVDYNEKDFPIEHRRYNPDNTLAETTRINYNDKNLPIEKIVTGPDSKTGSVTKFSYDDQDRMIRATETNQDGKVVSDILSVYDERGNVIERKIRDFHSRTLRFKFDDRNNCIEEEIFDEHGNLTLKSTYEFNEYNHVVSESGYYLDMNRGAQLSNSLSRYEYEYWE